MTFLAQLAILAVSTALGYLTRQRIKRPNAPDLEFPRAEEGIPVPLVYGTQAISPILTAVGDIVNSEGDDGERLYESLLVGDLCLGEIDAVVDIQIGGKSLRLHPLTKDDSISATDKQYAVVVEGTTDEPGLPYEFTTASVTFDVNARNLFGGPLQEGGVERHIRIHRGTLTDTVDPVLAHLWDAAGLPGGGTANPAVATITFGEVGLPFYWGTVAQPKTPVVLVRLIPNALGLGAIGINANPAEITYDILTHPLRGRGIDPALIDTASFVACGETLRAEGLGLSCTFSRPQETQDMLEEVGRHIHGDCYQSALTGLWTMVLARDDYDADTIPEVNRQNAKDLVIVRPSWRATTNEVTITFRQYDDSPLLGATVTGEPLTGPDGFRPNSIVGGVQILTAKGRFLTNVVVHNLTKATTLVEDTHYTLYPDTGTFWLRQVIDENEIGDDLTVDYTNGSALVGYKEATEIAQDLANQQATGDVRPEGIERPFFTDAINASVHAWRELKLKARPLAEATWTGTRADAQIVPGDVRAVTWTPESGDPDDFTLTRVPFRVTKVDYGELVNGAPKVTAVEDVFGASVLPSVPVGGDGSVVGDRTCPPMAALYCTGADTLALQASDVHFAIQLQRADDTDGTGAEDVEDSPLDGDTTSYTDATTGKTHRARQVRTGWTDGPWTAWVSVCTTGSVTCVLPAIVDSALVDGTTGTLAVDIDDPQLRVQSVEFRVTTAAGVVGSWTTDSATPYEATVTLVDGFTAFIARRVSYYDCDAELVIAEAEYPFVVAVEEPDPPGTGATVLDVPITLVTGQAPLCIRNFPADVARLTAGRGTEKRVPAAGVQSALIGASIDYTTVPVGGYLAIQFENPDVPGDWRYLGTDDVGPVLAVDEASLELADANPDEDAWVVWGDPVTMREEAKGAVRFRAIGLGGTDTEDISITELTVWVSAAPAQSPAPETPETPDTGTLDPGSCDVPSPLDVTDHDSQVQPSGATWSVDGTDVLLTLDGTGSGPASQTVTLTGLEANEQYTFYLTVDADTVAVGPFLTVVGGDTATATATGGETLVARGDTDGSGNITLTWGVTDIADAPASASADDLSYASQGAAESADWSFQNLQTPTGGGFTFDSGEAVGPFATSLILTTVNNGYFSGQSGDILAEKTYTVVSGQSYRVKVWAGSTAGNGWYSNASMRLTSGANSASHSIGGAEADKQLDRTIVASGTSLTVRLYATSGNVTAVLQPWRFAGLTIDGIAGGATEITFSDLGSCLGSGLGDGGTGLGEDGTDEIPDPPPGGYEPPPVGGDRPFGAWNIPAGGFAYWDSTIVALRLTNTVNLLNAAGTGSAQLFCKFGADVDWLDGAGRFSYDRWKASVDAVANDSRAMAALEAAITSGAAKIHYLADEPMLVSRWGLSIPLATIERMAQYSKSLWPTWATAIRVAPTNPWLTRHINGLDHLWAQYVLPKGDPTAWRDLNISRATAVGHGLIVGVNVYHFTNPNGGRAITAAELRHYGGIMASSSATAAFMMWRFNSTMYAQAGFPEAVQEVRDTFAANDP